MARQAEMFEKPKRPKPRRLAHVVDAGEFPDGRRAAKFECFRCGWSEWLSITTVSEAKRGHPCPNCNR